MAETIDWMPARLASSRDLTPDIRLFQIRPDAGFVRPTPGAHIKIEVRIEGRPDVRSYSVVGSTADGAYEIAVKLLPQSRGGSRYMWSLGAGARLTIGAPRNHFQLSLDKPDYLLLAGGIGITPIASMALALSRREAPFRLLYAARSSADLALADRLERPLADRLHVFLDAAGDRIDLAAEIARLAPGGEMYVCGPIGLLEAAKRAFAASGRPIDALRFETFGNSSRFATEPFAIHIPRLGRSVAVPADRTMLEALEAAGIAMISDCRRGECGLCALNIVETDGVVDHRDVFFSDEQKSEGRKLCTCVSRVSGGSITLDTPDRPR